MIFSFGQKDRGQLAQLAAILRLFDFDLYQDVFGAYWEFVYQRNLWQGINYDQEGKLMKLQIEGIEGSKTKALEQEGLKLEYIEIDEEKDKLQSCWGILIQVQSKLYTDKLSFEAEALCLYLPKANTLYISEKVDNKLETVKLTYEEFLCMVLRPCYPKLRLFSIKLNHDNSSRIDIHKLYQRWYLKMNSGVIEVERGSIKGTGLAGMKLLLEDIVLFSKHGHTEWMQAWLEAVVMRLKELASIRQGNLSLIHKYTDSSKNNKAISIVKACIDNWIKINTYPIEQYTYEELINCLSTIIEAEYNCLEYLKEVD